MKKFEVSKTYKTRDGREAIIYAILDDMIHGAIGKDIFKWGTNGKMSEYCELAEDLIPESDWEMGLADWIIYSRGEIEEIGGTRIASAQKFGMRYHSEKIAIREAKRMKEANIIAYWASVIEPNYVADWYDDTEYKHYIYIAGGVYNTAWSRVAKNIGVPYGSRETMQKICDALNNWDLEL